MTVPTLQSAEAGTVYRHPFTMATQLEGQTDGRAKTKGTVLFFSEKRAVVKGWIKDVCPADGAAAMLRARIILEKDVNNLIEKSIANDLNNCGNGRVEFRVRLPNDGYPISSVNLMLSEAHNDVFECSDHTDPCRFRTFENWHVS